MSLRLGAERKNREKRKTDACMYITVGNEEDGERKTGNEACALRNAKVNETSLLI
ncbi:hypothetical protein WN55_01182 [Dufourea novaeangliae]|uniref:Uncharacterized protein n=1 Tax=Dufourea novaeangliae TaxID=178035 RepID=A0A154PEB0_DUFNO|nr:hypothetical protein WN55_01182 [Dufourea novaeangliae]